jgi:hypothetical protein
MACCSLPFLPPFSHCHLRENIKKVEVNILKGSVMLIGWYEIWMGKKGL